MRLQDVIIRDTRANQPLAGLVAPGTLFFVTDELVTERSNGLIWQSYGGGIGTVGATGATGAAGAQGIQGIQGVQGIQGFQGIPGLFIQGNDGEDGLQGPPGPAGTGGSGGSVGSDSLSVSRADATAINYNLTTLGIVDWFIINGLTSIPRTTGSMHAKSGGFLGVLFDWVLSAGSLGTFSQNNGVTVTYTTTQPDDRTSALTAVSTGTGIFTTAGARYGFMFGHIPASKAVRRLVMYVGSYSCDTELLLTLNGQTQVISTTTYSGVASAGRNDIFTIDFSAPQGGDLSIRYTLLNVLGVNQGPNIKFYFAYITIP